MRKNIFITTFINILFNTAIAGLLTAIGFGGGFWINFVFSQCIGLSIYSINATLMCRIANKRLRALILTFSFPGSIMLGVSVAAWITDAGGWDNPQAWVAVVIGLFFGGIGSITYFLSQRIEQLDAEVKQRRLNEVESEKRQLEAHLKLLQAQIEPHFLFNTLANVSSLIETDPASARRLLERLNDWLRIALARARSENTTLGDELAMLENYLQILKIRFGDRLCWNIDAGETARLASFPPMLLQPLVENAIRHGIEPKVTGGKLTINALQNANQLTVSVHDDGVGFNVESKSGAGLENIRARLFALYGDAGKLILESNAQGGLTATLEISQCAP
ncbi:MAG: histidine kinase [Gallionellaceae bacterium]|jgi:LytS/YehU family sensor histidine kinase